MNSIEIRSMSVNHVIRDMAEALGAEVKKECEEYSLRLPTEMGTGYVTGIDTDSGMLVLLYDCTFREDIQIYFNIEEVHPLKFLYIIEGKLEHFFEDYPEKVHKIDTYQSAIIASKVNNGHVLTFKAGTRIRIHSLEINRKTFKETMECDLKKLRGKIKSLFEDIDAQNHFYFKDHFTLELADLFKKMYDFDEMDYLRKIYLEGMAYQALIKQILLYLDYQEDENNRRLLRASEVEQIKKAVSFIEENITETPGVEEIAKEVGLNVNKLQYGFRMLYDTTVNKFAHKTRLNIARNLLLHTDYNVSEVANSVGLHNKSYFSKVFKESYHISPSEFKQKNKPLKKDINSN